jgi:hypothetical protein
MFYATVILLQNIYFGCNFIYIFHYAYFYLSLCTIPQSINPFVSIMAPFEEPEPAMEIS